MLRRFVLAIALGLAVASGAWAQLASQTALVGTVKDNGGGVIPGASVTAVNVETQDTYQSLTNQLGQYNIPNIRIGRYSVTIALEGFKTFQATGIEVGGNQVVRRDAVLEVGALTETVTVAGRSAALATDRAAVSQTLDERAVSELPVAGRNVWSLASTTPGVLAGSTSDIGFSFRGAGQRNIQNNMTLDGISSSSNLLAMTSMRPIQDAVEEVQVQTGSTSAEYGSFLGVHVNVVTKAGTNQFHGSAYQYYQDEALNARGLFDNRSVPKNPLGRDQYGVVANGPVVLPKLYDGHNRTFFMAAYEGIGQEEQTSPIISVPTEKMRRGDFSEISTQIRNPFTRQPFAGNVIPSSMLSPVSLQLLQYYPLPTAAGTASNYQGPADDDDEHDQVLVRVDQNLGNRTRLSFRYNWLDTYEVLSPSAIEIQPVWQPRVNKNWLASYTHSLRSNLHNDFRIGYHRMDVDTLNYFWVRGVQGAGSALGIPGFDADVQYQNHGIPDFGISAFSGLGQGGTNWHQYDTTFQLSDVLSYTRGSHNLRAGFDARRMATWRESGNQPRGQFTFNGDMSGYSMADFMLGVPRSVVTTASMLAAHVGHWRNGFFVNDVWQATPKMTLSLGLRYELNTVAQSYTGFASELNEDFTRIIPSENPLDYPVPGFRLHNPNYGDIAPRIGGTYRLTEKTVLRGGWGIYFNPNQMNTFTFLTNNPPLAPRFTYNNDPNNATLTLGQPSGVATTAPPDITTPDRNLPNAWKNQWSFDIQQELWPSTVLEVQYLASRTKNLDRSFFVNTPTPGAGGIQSRRPNPNFGNIRVIENDLIANYDSLAFVLRRRMMNGLALNAHYTWSRTRDMSEHSNSGGRIVNDFDIWSDYGPANWDVPHRFVVSGIYELPFFGASGNPFLRSVLGGWQVSGVATFQSGTPLNVTIQGDRANTGSPSQRPDVLREVELDCQPNPSGPGLINCIDPTALALPAQFTYGNAPRNMLRGPGFSRTDVALSKNFVLPGRMRVTVQAQVFNLFNEINWGSPNTTFGAANFGRVTSAGSMRQMELGIRLTF
jgi:Carboxypeptidase regulatory-like domain/TonB dependent receptor